MPAASNSTALNPTRDEIVRRYLSGEKPREIAQAIGLGVWSVYKYLREPEIQEVIKERMASLETAIVDFKLRAFEAATASFEKLANLALNGKTEELQRLASLDTVKIAGLMPRRRILVETNKTNGIDEDTREWLQQVMRESNGHSSVEIINAEINPGP